MDIKSVKSQFPIFKNKINGKPLIYLDSANSSQKPGRVIDRISKFYSKEFSNIGRSVHTLAVTATNRFEETRDLVKKYINAKAREEIIFTKNATEGMNLVASTYGAKFINKGDEINLQAARLIPFYKPGEEMSLTSIFLSALRLIKEFRENISKSINLSRSGKMFVFTEVEFALFDKKRVDEFCKKKKLWCFVFKMN